MKKKNEKSSFKFYSKKYPKNNQNLCKKSKITKVQKIKKDLFQNVDKFNFGVLTMSSSQKTSGKHRTSFTHSKDRSMPVNGGRSDFSFVRTEQFKVNKKKTVHQSYKLGGDSSCFPPHPPKKSSVLRTQV